MSHLKFSARILEDLQRLYDFLAQYSVEVADSANATIIDGFSLIETTPSTGSPLPDRKGVRKLVIDFGESGYLIFHKHYEKTDTSLLLAVLHQKERYKPKTIGRIEERKEDAEPE